MGQSSAASPPDVLKYAAPRDNLRQASGSEGFLFSTLGDQSYQSLPLHPRPFRKNDGLYAPEEEAAAAKEISTATMVGIGKARDMH